MHTSSLLPFLLDAIIEAPKKLSRRMLLASDDTTAQNQDLLAAIQRGEQRLRSQPGLVKPPAARVPGSDQIRLSARDPLLTRRSMLKGMGVLAFCAVLAGCGPSSPRHDAQVVDTLVYGEGNGITVVHDSQRHVTCWIRFAAMSCLPDATMTASGK